MRSILALAIKDLRLLKRDRVALFFTLFFPILFATFFGTIFSGQASGSRVLQVVVADLDQSASSKEFIKQINAGGEMQLSEVSSRADASQRVLAGGVAGYMVIPAGFGAAQENLFGPTADRQPIELGVDPSRQAERGMLEGVVQKYAFANFGQALSDPAKLRSQVRSARKRLGDGASLPPAMRESLGTLLTAADALSLVMPAAATGAASGGSTQTPIFQPVSVSVTEVRPQIDASAKTYPTNAYAFSFPQGIIWGIMGCTIGFGISLVVERQHGTLARLQLAPMPRIYVLLGKGLACFITTAGVCVMLLLIASLVFSVRFNSVPMLAMAVVCVSIAFVGLMMLTACGGSTESATSGIGWSVMMVFALLGGAAVPLFVMPGWVRDLSDISPVKWSIIALEGAIWRGFTMQQMLLPCGILLAVGIGGFTIGGLLFQRAR